LSYRTIQYAFYPQDAQGRLLPPVVGTWDTHTKIGS